MRHNFHRTENNKHPHKLALSLLPPKYKRSLLWKSHVGGGAKIFPSRQLRDAFERTEMVFVGKVGGERKFSESECLSWTVLKGTERNAEWQTMIELCVCCISPSTWNECFWHFVSPKSRLRLAKTDFGRTFSWKLSKTRKLDQKQRSSNDSGGEKLLKFGRKLVSDVRCLMNHHVCRFFSSPSLMFMNILRTLSWE